MGQQKTGARKMATDKAEGKPPPSQSDDSKKRAVPAPVEAAAEWADLASLIPWSGNPRRNELAIEKVAASIRRFGFGAPLIARLANREIIGGHTRFEAARLLELKQVPVRFLDLDERQSRLLALADNKLAEDAKWDDQKLATVLRELRAGPDGDSDLIVAGFTDSDTLAMMAKVDTDNSQDGAKNGAVQIVRFRKFKLPLTPGEAERLHNKIAGWLEQKGQLHGFAGKLFR